MKTIELSLVPFLVKGSKCFLGTLRGEELRDKLDLINVSKEYDEIIINYPGIYAGGTVQDGLTNGLENFNKQREVHKLILTRK